MQDLQDLITQQPYTNLITPKRIVYVILGVIVLGCLATSFYTVEADEIAVVLMFGKSVRQAEPGLHFKLPLGIERAINVPVRKVFKEEFGFRTIRAGVRTQYDTRDYADESLLLTGDLSIADVEWVVQYKIKDPKSFLFFVRNPQRALRDLSESVMSRIVGDRTVTEVLTVGRIEIAAEVEEHLQRLLDLYQRIRCHAPGENCCTDCDVNLTSEHSAVSSRCFHAVPFRVRSRIDERFAF